MNRLKGQARRAHSFVGLYWYRYILCRSITIKPKTCGVQNGGALTYKWGDWGHRVSSPWVIGRYLYVPLQSIFWYKNWSYKGVLQTFTPQCLKLCLRTGLPMLTMLFTLFGGESNCLGWVLHYHCWHSRRKDSTGESVSQYYPAR